MLCLPLTRLNFWLATIDVKKVASLDVRARILAYQNECADVLFAYFFGKATGVFSPDFKISAAMFDESARTVEKATAHAATRTT